MGCVPRSGAGAFLRGTTKEALTAAAVSAVGALAAAKGPDLVRKVVGARHVIANLTLDIGEVAYDYLAPPDELRLAVNQ